MTMKTARVTPDEVTYTSPVEEVRSAQAAPYVERYLNARVTIYYNPGQGVTDTGQVTYIDNNWVELTKDNGERLLAPVQSIRIIKLVEASKLKGDAAALLRPADERKQISGD